MPAISLYGTPTGDYVAAPPAAKYARVSHAMEALGSPDPDDPFVSLRHILSREGTMPDDITHTSRIRFERFVLMALDWARSVSPNSAPAIRKLLREHMRDAVAGYKISFIVAYIFLESAFGEKAADIFYTNNPYTLLQTLSYPDKIFEQTGKKPAEQQGFANVVKELAQEILDRQSRGENPPRDFFLPIPVENVRSTTPIDHVSAARLVASYHLIESLAAGGAEYEPGEASRVPIPTIQPAYKGVITGGRGPVTSDPPIQPLHKEKGETTFDGWLAYESVGEVRDLQMMGRFYFALKGSHRADLWNEIRRLRQALPPEKKFSSKISLVDSDYKLGRGDAAVFYFRAGDQLYYLPLIVSLAEAHPEWFYDNRRPVFAAQILNTNGAPVKGLSFAQQPPIYVSFNQRGAGATTRTARHLRLLNALEHRLDDETKVRIIARALEIEGVDPAHPAFNLGAGDVRRGTDVFDFIWRHTDQYDLSL